MLTVAAAAKMECYTFLEETRTMKIYEYENNGKQQ